MKQSSTYCKLSHLGIAVQNFADYCSCNANNFSWKDNEHNVMHVYSHPLKQASDSYTRKVIYTALDHGIKHPSCQPCWNQEQVGITSIRQQYNEKLSHIEPLPSNQPRVVIIKPGNTCNLACRMCNPATSSSWYADAYQLEGQPGTFNEYTKTFETIRTSFGNRSLEFWDTLKKWTEHLEIIDIYGGEPFLNPEMFDVLEHAVVHGFSKNITVYINTNASIFNQRYVDILKQFKLVEFKVSVDSADKHQFEYIRHKANYEQVMDTIQRFKHEFANVDTVSMCGIITITPLNIYHVGHDIQQLSQQLDLHLIENFVYTDEYDARHLPIAIKQWLINNSTSQNVRNWLALTVPGCDQYWPEFCKLTDQLDKIRGQSFSTTFPEWWRMLEPYWVSSHK